MSNDKGSVRFDIVCHLDKVLNREYFSIKDLQAKALGTDESPVQLNFVNKQRAITVCDLMNQEWEQFLRNPW